jgi:putative hemolysin
MYGKLVANEDEKTEALALISKIFQEEYGSSVENTEENRKGDFLIVKNKTDQIVGAYRMIRNEGNVTFSNDDFFDFSYFKNYSKPCAELGRAVVHPAYRDGSAISLLWKLIAEYLFTFNIKYTFGCTSVSIQKRKNNLENDTAKILSYIKQKDAFTYLPVFPKKVDYPLYEFFENNKLIYEKEKDKKIVPTLIKGYCKQGAKFSPYIVKDEKFGSIDFLTIFDTDNESVQKIFKG